MAPDSTLASALLLKRSRLVGHVLGELSGLIIGGAVLGFLYGIVHSQNRWTDGFSGAVIALASAAVGGFFGLLFGVPRALAGSSTSTGGASAGVGGYGGNTNLEQISDWLTKLLLGAGLTQLARVPSGLRSLGSYLGPGLGGGSGAASFAVVLVIYSLLIGFFLAFLAARLKLGAAFREADDLAQSKPAVEAKINLLPPATAGPTMLHVGQNATPDAQRAALELSQQIQAIEEQTEGSAFAADAYQRVAKELVAAKLYEEALRILDVGSTQHPNDASLPLFAGAIYGMYLKEYDSADRSYFKALGINPTYALAFYNLACNAVRQDKLSEARDYLTKAFGLDPSLSSRSSSDPVWDNVRASAELRDLFPPDSPDSQSS